MKGSGVVQSLKSLASKLHPQLPLSPKESQRLLTALTSSFRQQLDQAHPHRVGGEDAKANQEDAARPKLERLGVRSLHASSIDSADKHLTSVLTSPLLTRPYGSRALTLDYESAQKSLQEDPYQDPASLLEDYHENGVATIPIAALCLEKFSERLARLDDAARAKVVSETRAGSRTLYWLWNSKLHDTDGFVDDRRLMVAMVRLIIEEGYEDLLWDWLKLDVKLGSQDKKYPNEMKQAVYACRWKSRVLGEIVGSKLTTDRRRSADDALDVVFKARKINRSLPLGTWIPFAPSVLAIQKAFQRRGAPFERTDVAKFERFVEVAVSCVGLKVALQRHTKAVLTMYHPQSPSAWPYLELFRMLFAPGADSDEGARVLLRYINKPIDLKTRVYWFRSMVDVAAMLEVDGNMKERDWMISQIKRIFPDWEGRIPSALEDQYRQLGKVRQTAEAPNRDGSEETPLPFPTFT
jgi:hypothetical protein